MVVIFKIRVIKIETQKANSFNLWGMTIRSTVVPEFCRKNYIGAASLMQLWRWLAILEALGESRRCLIAQEGTGGVDNSCSVGRRGV